MCVAVPSLNSVRPAAASLSQLEKALDGLAARTCSRIADLVRGRIHRYRGGCKRRCFTPGAVPGYKRLRFLSALSSDARARGSGSCRSAPLRAAVKPRFDSPESATAALLSAHPLPVQDEGQE